MSATASRHPRCRPHFAFARVSAISWNRLEKPGFCRLAGTKEIAAGLEQSGFARRFDKAARAAAALLLAIAGGAAAAQAQGSRIGAPPAGAPPDQGAMPPPTSQGLAD